MYAPSKMSLKTFIATFDGDNSLAFTKYLDTLPVLPLLLVSPVFQNFTTLLECNPDDRDIQFAKSYYADSVQSETLEANMELKFYYHYRLHYQNQYPLKHIVLLQPDYNSCCTGLSVKDKDKDFAFILNFEFKVPTNTSSHPLLQSAAYFHYSKSSCAYLIVITTYTIQVCGARRLPMEDGKLQCVVEILTGVIELSDERKVAQVFYAIRHTLLDIEKVTIPLNIIDILPKVTNITYTKNLVAWKYVFEATCHDDGSRVVVKFVYDKYGTNVHQLLHQCNFAPLYCFENIVCQCLQWKAIVMELVEGTLLLDYVPASPLLLETVTSNLRNILKVLDANNFVHGDLRTNNIIVTVSGEVKVLDFDWAGISGESRYPQDINTADITWPTGVKGGGRIMKEHDQYWIEKAIQDLTMSHDLYMLQKGIQELGTE